MESQSQAYNFDPDNVAPPEVQNQLLDVLKWHDDVLRDLIEKIEMVPGLENVVEEFSNALNEYIYTVIAPYIGASHSFTNSIEGPYPFCSRSFSLPQVSWTRAVSSSSTTMTSMKSSITPMPTTPPTASSRRIISG
jgi:hypothetical protein